MAFPVTGAQPLSMSGWKIPACLASLLAALVSGAVAIAAAPEEQEEALLIVVSDRAGLDQAEAQAMKTMMRAFLLNSGIRLKWDWRRKGEGSAAVPGIEDPGVLPQIEIEIQAKKPARYQRDPLVLGLTTLGSRQATLYLAEADRLNEAVPVGMGKLMGLAAIHEIGHVLLGRAHCPWGAMTTKWNRPEVERLLKFRMPFSRLQSKALREEIRRRRFEMEQARKAARTTEKSIVLSGVGRYPDVR